ncbi:MAG: Methyltransferase FkbM family [Candidatus Daviesbacteria bacterium GW2011_GWA2_38_24]|uniref:Methyltransferase FkbM family n=1 Tax=Candidatus Daviesbacteria bacterium GW2011_GWA2_38_24 TaxID=1618422 RepID=A0A0G0JTH3_9BACT|nr:MAG: Methyltransferase FkbM family [Candidatus Daviesbacteria bacterium GW2011_GWA2_38_24]
MRRNMYDIVKYEGFVGLLQRLRKKNRYHLWHNVFPNGEIRYQYCLNPDSTVIDVGGYNGDWAARIHEKFGCTVRIFEPVQEFAERIKKRFSGNPNIIVERYGLGAENGTVTITKMEDSSSSFCVGKHQEIVQLRKASEVLTERSIDLMKINIEGGEYQLLLNLLDEGIAQRIGNIQVQFHEFVPGASKFVQEIRNRLTETHSLLYKVDYVLEDWQRK